MIEQRCVAKILCAKFNVNVDGEPERNKYSYDFLDELIPVKYYLEVSSPGIERTLRKEKHYKSQIGNEIEIFKDYVNDAIVSKEGRRNKKRGTLTQLEQELEEREIEKDKTDIRRMLERKRETGENIKNIVKDTRMQIKRRT